MLTPLQLKLKVKNFTGKIQIAGIEEIKEKKKKKQAGEMYTQDCMALVIERHDLSEKYIEKPAK